MATSYETGLPKQVLVEAKSGGWGFADIFKVRGWMTYLDIPDGAFFASKEIEKKDPAFVHKKSSVLGIRFVHFGDFTEARKRFQEAGFPAIEDQHVVDLWRMSYWAEREMIVHLRQHAKSNATQQGPAAILEYLHLVNNGVFFTSDIRQRLRDLYAAFQQHPKLAQSDSGKSLIPLSPPTQARFARFCWRARRPPAHRNRLSALANGHESRRPRHLH